jgi:hypothetical protein
MDKKEIYEHLAKIYLDASSKSSKKRKKNKSPSNLLRNTLLVIIVILAAFTFLLFKPFFKSKAFKSEFALVLLPEATKINFHFDPAKKEMYSLALNKLNLIPYKALGFSAKNVDYNDSVSLRVEFSNAFKEKSEIYIKHLPRKWQDYKINFSQFQGITDWSQMYNLSFTVEEWNAEGKKGVVLIDNVRLLR